MEEDTGEKELKTEEKPEETAENTEDAPGEERTEEIQEEEKKEEVAQEVVEEAPAAEGEEEKLEPMEMEEARPPPRAEKPEEEEIVEERIYTIPLSKAWIMPPKKRAPRAMRIIRSFVTKHMKLEARGETEEEEAPRRLIISNEVNEQIWRRGIEKPSRKIRIRAAKDKEGNVTVYLAKGD